MYIRSHPVILLSALLTERRFHALVPVEKRACCKWRPEGTWIKVARSKVKAQDGSRDVH